MSEYRIYQRSVVGLVSDYAAADNIRSEEKRNAFKARIKDELRRRFEVLIGFLDSEEFDSDEAEDIYEVFARSERLEVSACQQEFDM